METTVKPRFHEVRARTAQVVAHHYSTENPDKPLWLLVPGAMIALAALAVILNLAWETWYSKTLKVDQGVSWILLLAPVYATGVFLFSYGYELYDLGAALRLTLTVVAITALAVLMLAVLFAVLSESKGGSKSSSGSRSGSGSGGSSGGGFGLDLGRGGHWSSSSASPSVPGTSGPIVPLQASIASAALPPAMACPACGQSFFLGSRTLYCPSCGGSISQDLLKAALNPRAPQSPPGA